MSQEVQDIQDDGAAPIAVERGGTRRRAGRAKQFASVAAGALVLAAIALTAACYQVFVAGAAPAPVLLGAPLLLLAVGGLFGAKALRAAYRVPPDAGAPGHESDREACPACLEKNTAKALLESKQVLFVALDSEGRIRQFNRACENLTGYSAEEVFGRYIWDTVLPDDQIEPVKAVFRNLATSRLPSEYRNAWKARDGRKFMVAWNNSVVQARDGSVEAVVAFGIDITDRDRVASQLARAVQRLEHAQQTARIGNWEWNAQTSEQWWSDESYRVVGLEPGSCPPTDEAFLSVIHPDDQDRVRQIMQSSERRMTDYEFTCRVVTPDGEERVVREVGYTRFDENGVFLGQDGTIQDVTREQRALRELETAKARLEEAQRIAGLGNWDWDPETDRLHLSDLTRQLMGIDLPPGMVTNDYYLSLLHPGDRQGLLQLMRSSLKSGEGYSTEYRVVRPDGDQRVISELAEVFERDGRRLIRGTVQDVTAYRQAQESLESTLRRLADSQRVAKIGNWDWDCIADEEWWSDQQFRNYGLAPNEIDHKANNFLQFVHPDDREIAREAVQRTAEEGVPLDIEFRAIGADGTERTLWGLGRPELDRNGRTVRVLGTTHDVTAQRKREKELQATELRFELAFQLNPGMTAISEVETGMHVDVNDKWLEIMGYERAEVIGRTAQELGIWADPANREHVVGLLKETGRFRDIEVRFRTRHGELRDFLISAEPFPLDEREHMLIVGHDVTERKRMDNALRESEELFRSVFDQAAVGIAQVRPDGRILSVNQKFAEILGYPQDELQALRFHEITHPDDLEADVRDFERLLAGEIPFYSMEKRYIRGDASILWGDLTVSLVRHKDGTPKYIIGVVQDIDNRKRAEEEASRSNRYLDLFFKHSLTSFVLMDRDFNFIRVNDAYAKADQKVPEDFPGRNHFDLYPSEAKPLFEQVRDGKEPFLAVATPFEYADHPERGVTYWDWALVPIAGDDGEAEMIVLSLNEVTERVRAEQALQESEARLSAFFAEAPAGLGIIDSDCRYVKLNETLARMNGLSISDHIGMRPSEIMPPARAGTIEGLIRRTLDGEVVESEEGSAPGPDGKMRHWVYSQFPISGDPQNPDTLGLVAVDITDLQAARQEAKKLAENLAEAQRLAHVGHWEWRPESDRSFWSDEMHRIFGFEPGSIEITHETFYQVLHEDDRDALYAAMNATLETGKPYEMELKAWRADGKLLYIVERAERYADPVTGQHSLRGVIQDLTARRQAEIERSKLLHNLNRAQEIAKIGSWEWDLRDGTQQWSEQSYRLFGLEPESVTPDQDTFLTYVHPDDRPAVITASMRMVEEKEPLAIEYRSIGADGKTRTLAVQGEVEFDSIGKAVRITGTAQDITELKKAQSELARLNAELEARVEQRTAELRAAQGELVKSERLATLGKLTATVSHELRNPLGTMRTSMYVVEKTAESEDRRLRAAIDRVNRNITRCDRIIDELLDFTRIRELEITSTEIDPWLEGLLDEQVVPEGVTVERRFGAGRTALPADADRLRRAVINVFENACQAVQEMNGQESADAPRIVVETRLNGDRLEICISDNGPGVPAEVAEKIFEPLFSTKNFGVGLGLPTVRQIMRQHGGGVEIDLAAENGAMFALWLPMVGELEVAST